MSDTSNVVPIGKIKEYGIQTEFSLSELRHLLTAINMKLGIIKRAKDIVEAKEEYYLSLQKHVMDDLANATLCTEFENNVLAQIEGATVMQTLEANRNNMTHTARELGISRRSLYRRVEKLKTRGYIK